MSALDEARDAYQQVYNSDDNEAKFALELIAAAVAFAAMQIFENQQREEGKAIEHAVAKEILAGIVAAELIRLIETKGDDEIDKDAARQQAQDVSCTIYEQYYVVELNADEYDPNQYPQPDLN